MGVWFCLYNKCILMNFLCHYCRELFFLGRWLPAVRRQKSETTANNCWTIPGTMIKCIRCLFSIRPDTRKKRFADTFYIFFTTSSIEFTYRSKHTEPNEVNCLFYIIIHQATGVSKDNSIFSTSLLPNTRNRSRFQVWLIPVFGDRNEKMVSFPKDFRW